MISQSELKGRNFGLDIMRVVAVLMVLVCHSLGQFWSVDSLQPLGVFFGAYGVDLFFVLSGFLIGTILIKIYNKEERLTYHSIQHFWIRRWFRTLPNYFLMLGVYILFFHHYNLPVHYRRLPMFLVFLQNTFYEAEWFYAVSWSLAVEEWFYLTFPLTLWLMQYFLPGRKKRTVVAAILVFALGCLAIRTGVHIFTNDAWELGFRKKMPLRLDSIAIGVFAAFVKFYFKRFWEKSKAIGALLGALLFVPLSWRYYVVLIKEPNLMGDFFMNTLFFTFISLAIALILPAIDSIKPKAPVFIVRCITYLSLISYSIYLIHPLLMVDIGYYFDTRSGILPVTLLWASTFIISYLVYVLFERPATNLRERFK